MLFVLGPVLLSLLSAGCFGTDDAAEPAPSAPAPVVEPDPELPIDVRFSLTGVYPWNSAFEPGDLRLGTGRPLHVTFTNTDMNPMGKHDWTLEGLAKTEVVPVGASATVEVDALEPGSYAYYCSVPSHRDRGMEGVLVVA